MLCCRWFYSSRSLNSLVLGHWESWKILFLSCLLMVDIFSFNCSAMLSACLVWFVDLRRFNCNLTYIFSNNECVVLAFTSWVNNSRVWLYSYLNGVACRFEHYSLALVIFEGWPTWIGITAPTEILQAACCYNINISEEQQPLSAYK